DMIASGNTLVKATKHLKERGAEKVFVAATFGLFNEGPGRFNELYKNGFLNRVYSTNLTYASPQILDCEWFKPVDISFYLANIINALNSNKSIGPLITSKERLIALARRIRGELK
ncbi:MAG: ribose-phosphate pyrophosphokinase, partial [Defluviitaleaceae bacterium]|nr:ribose-phosphate pyrophosphokinase [Defluviitaleaceae bacterium]